MNEYLLFQERVLNESVGNMSEIDGYNCKLCNNKGLIFFIRGDEVVSRVCKCRLQRRALRMMNSICKGGERPTLDNYYDREAWQERLKNGVKAYLNSQGGEWLFIGGQSGSGKTHLCTAVCYELIEREKSIVYMRWLDSIREIKDSLKSGSYIDEINKYKKCDVLYIDDLFKGSSRENISDADIKIAFEIINSRYCDKGKITIVSSEYTLGELSMIDEATASRIKERAGKYIYSIAKDRARNYRGALV